MFEKIFVLLVSFLTLDDFFIILSASRSLYFPFSPKCMLQYYEKAVQVKWNYVSSHQFIQ
jgi:hypothetical protein